MNTKIIKIDKNNIDKKLIKEAANIIKSGGIVAFPTETVYGLGANGLDEQAIKKIYRAKGRPVDNPLILHISEKEQLNPLVKDIPDIAHDLMAKFWPGPLTMIFKKSEIVPNIISAGLDTVAIRMPNHYIAKELISESKVPIAAPSANISGKPSPTKGIHVIEDMMGKVEMIIDGGDTGLGLESTVLDLSIEIPIILRPGGITFEELKDHIPNIAQDESIINMEEIPKSPGQKYRHYAPNADMILYIGDIEKVVDEIKKASAEFIKEGKNVGIMATEETKNEYEEGHILISGSRFNRETIAHNLFDTLRCFDELNVDIILAEGVSSDNIGMAIMNRMVKAASGKLVEL